MTEPQDVATIAQQVTALAVEVERVISRQKALGEEQAKARERARLNANPAPSGPKAKPAVEWMTVSEGPVAVAELGILVGWVATVWEQYDRPAPCWPWHPQVVAELLACRQAWVGAKSATAPPGAMADWHNRVRPNSAAVLRHRLTDCSRADGHMIANPERPCDRAYYNTDPTHLEDYAGWWAACHGITADPSTAPGITFRSTRLHIGDVDWMTITQPDLAQATLAELQAWVANVWTKYDPIHPCWPWHPQVVAELLACRRVWIAATTDQAPALAPADWHQRFRVGTHKAITTRLKACSPGDHRGGADSHYHLDPDQVPALAAWWAISNDDPSTDHGLAPGLTLTN